MRLRPYVEIMRVDHWFKNAFMVLGVVVALFYEPSLFSPAVIPDVLLAVLVACLVASSNYVLNEILDGPTDAAHPFKRTRPVPAGLVDIRVAYLEWLALATLGFGLALQVNVPFACAAAALWVMGTLYNVRPFRTKEIPYVDVLTEAINNPIRLLLGWFALIENRWPPLSLLLAYWALGCFFMGTKRFAELRALGDRNTAVAYRRSFGHYTEDNLLVSMMFYASACALCGGVFIVRCKVELVLCVPLLAGMLAYYMRLGLREDSPVQHPERLHRERGFTAFTLLTFCVFVLLMFTEIPGLYQLIGMDPPKLAALWIVR